MATKFFKKNGVDSFTMYLLFGDHCWKSSKVGCVFFFTVSNVWTEVGGGCIMDGDFICSVL